MKYKEFIEKIDTLKRKGDILVAIKLKYSWDQIYSVINELLFWDEKANDYIWQNDWNEGEEDIEIVGYMFVRDIDITGAFITPKDNRPKSVWVGIDQEPHEEWECDNCGNIINTYLQDELEEYKYCHKCGAKMSTPWLER